MLILSRNINQSIFIGEEIAVKVLGVKDDKVRLGIEAQREISVQREETFQQTNGNTAKM
jgi:carbon storage regulator